MIRREFFTHLLSSLTIVPALGDSLSRSEMAKQKSLEKLNFLGRFQHGSATIAVGFENTSFGEYQPRHFLGRLLSFSWTS